MQVKTDFTGFLQSDAAPQKMEQTEYCNLENFRMGATSDTGRTMQLETIGAMKLLINEYLTEEGCISNGDVEDNAKQRFFQFVWSPSGAHAIYGTDGTNVYKVLLSSQVTGGLGLSKDNFIHSADVVGNLLYWTDNLNQPRRINTESGIKLNHPSYVTDQDVYLTPLAQENITLIRRAPQLPLQCDKLKGSDFGIDVVQNFIKNQSLQFTYYYIFKDYETSVTATRSLLFNYNFKDDLNDVIRLKVPFAEKIQQDVYEIYLAAENKETGKYFVIKKWGVYNNADKSEITNHNAGTTQLTFFFKGDYFGAGLGDSFPVKPFESIPLLSEGQEVAKDRLMLGNNLLGYDTPTTTSLNTALIQGGTSPLPDQTVDWQEYIFDIELTDGVNTFLQSHFFKLFELVGGNSGYYSVGQDYEGPLVTTGDFQVLFYLGKTEADLYNSYIGAADTAGDTRTIVRANGMFRSDAPNQITISNIGATVPLSGIFFKTDSTYKASIVFYDGFQRKCGVVEVPGTITIPTRKAAYDSYYTYIKWQLHNGTDVFKEIPVWATHYQIVITKSKNISYFIEGVAANYKYAKKDVDGKYNFEGVNPGDDYVGLAIDLSELLNTNLGYTYQEKDLAVLYLPWGGGSVVYSDINLVEGKWLIVNYKDVGVINGSSPSPFVYEVRSPVDGGEDIFYEVAECYQVVNSGTSAREYSTLTGNIRGDTYIVKHTVRTLDYYLEAVSPNDKFPKAWFTDAGRPNAVDRIGQKRITGGISFSNVNLQGTKNNGLSSFDALDTDTVALENGAIHKLQLTSKTQDAGTIMLAICSKETTSIYLGEAQLIDQTGNAFVAKASGVIGTMNTLKGGFGTTNPESVIEHRGNVYWYDANSGDFIFYSVNGVHSMTNKRARRFAKLFSDRYNALTRSEIEAMGNRPLVLGGVDVYHKEIMWSIPKTGTNPNGELIDLGIEYPYDFWDGHGKTVVFKLVDTSNAPMGAYTFNSEGFCSIGTRTFAFKAGKLYEMNRVDEGYNVFFGVEEKAKVMYVTNADPSVPKVAHSIAVEANRCPDYVHFRTEYPYAQSSDLLPAEFTELEGIFYAKILRDRISPFNAGQYDRNLYFGDRMRGTFLYQMIEFYDNTNIVQLKAANTEFVASRGAKV